MFIRLEPHLTHHNPPLYPLLYLRSELIDFKLKRLDGVLAAVPSGTAPGEDRESLPLLAHLLVNRR